MTRPVGSSFTRKVIQITGLPSGSDDCSDAVVALCNDGTMWFGRWHSGSNIMPWTEITPVPLA